MSKIFVFMFLFILKQVICSPIDNTKNITNDTIITEEETDQLNTYNNDIIDVIDNTNKIIANGFGIFDEKITALSLKIKESIEDGKIKKGLFTWKIIKYSQKMGEFICLSSIHTAFSMWESITDLKFVFTPNTDADFNFSFVNSIHDTSINTACIPFDGATLAHAYYPTTTLAGEVHINDNFNFNNKLNMRSFSLLHVLIHEIGHALGLPHNQRSTSIMYPTENVNRHFKLKTIFDFNDHFNLSVKK